MSPIILIMKNKSSGDIRSMEVHFDIVNIVCTAKLSHSIKIDCLPKIFPNEIIYDKKIYGGRVAYFKSEFMQGKVTIFPSGKVISVGTKSIEEAIKELNLVAKALKSGLTEPEIRNIVATSDLGHMVDLEQISLIREISSIYEPEQFPGAIIKIPLSEENMATILLFASGKLVCLGLKKLEDIKEAIVKLISLINALS